MYLDTLVAGMPKERKDKSKVAKFTHGTYARGLFVDPSTMSQHDDAGGASAGASASASASANSAPAPRLL